MGTELNLLWQHGETGARLPAELAKMTAALGGRKNENGVGGNCRGADRQTGEPRPGETGEANLSYFNPSRAVAEGNC